MQPAVRALRFFESMTIVCQPDRCRSLLLEILHVVNCFLCVCFRARGIFGTDDSTPRLTPPRLPCTGTLPCFTVCGFRPNLTARAVIMSTMTRRSPRMSWRKRWLGRRSNSLFSRRKR